MKATKLKRAVIKEELVDLTGSMVSAVLLNQFIYWSERTKDTDIYIDEEKARISTIRKSRDIAEHTKVDYFLDTLKTHGWIYKTAVDIKNETMLDVSSETIRNHIKELVAGKWLHSRNNPKFGWDRTLQYRVNLVKIQRDLAKLGYALDGYRSIDDATIPNGVECIPSSVESIPSSVESIPRSVDSIPGSVGAIPEITTETTVQTTIDITSSITTADDPKGGADAPPLEIARRGDDDDDHRGLQGSKDNDSILHSTSEFSRPLGLELVVPDILLEDTATILAPPPDRRSKEIAKLADQYGVEDVQRAVDDVASEIPNFTHGIKNLIGILTHKLQNPSDGSVKISSKPTTNASAYIPIPHKRYQFDDMNPSDTPESEATNWSYKCGCGAIIENYLDRMCKQCNAEMDWENFNYSVFLQN